MKMFCTQLVWLEAAWYKEGSSHWVSSHSGLTTQLDHFSPVILGQSLLLSKPRHSISLFASSIFLFLFKLQNSSD